MNHLTTRDLYIRYLDGEATLEEIERAVRQTVTRYRQLQAATTLEVRQSEAGAEAR